MSLRLRLRSGLRQCGNLSSTKMARREPRKDERKVTPAACYLWVSRPFSGAGYFYHSDRKGERREQGIGNREQRRAVQAKTANRAVFVNRKIPKEPHLPQEMNKPQETHLPQEANKSQEPHLPRETRNSRSQKSGVRSQNKPNDPRREWATGNREQS